MFFVHNKWRGTLLALLLIGGLAAWWVARPGSGLSTVVLRVEGVEAPAQARRLQDQVAAVPGVAACTISPHTSLAIVSYDEPTVSKPEIIRVLSVGGLFRVEEVPSAAE